MLLLQLLAVMSAIVPVGDQKAKPHAIKLSDYRSLISISSPRISPDGKWIAVVRSVPDFNANKQVTSICLVEADTGRLRALTDGKMAVSSPRWSPSGSQIAYISQGANKSDQVFVRPLLAGAPRQVTHSKHDVQQFAWAPNGKRIAYVTPDDDPNAAAIARHDDLFEIHDDGYLIQSAAVPSHLWLVDSDGSNTRRITHGAWSILETPGPLAGGPSDPSWSLDGKQISFARQSNANNGDSDTSTIAAVEVATGRVTSLTNGKGYEYQPAFASTSNRIAFLHPHGPTPLSVMDLSIAANGESDDFTTFNHDVADFSWLHDGVVMMANEGVQTGLWLQKPGKSPQRIDLGKLCVTEVSAGKTGSIAIIASGFAAPPELYQLTDPEAKPRRLTELNAALGRLHYAKSEEYRWKAPDGEPCDGVLTYPVGYVQGSKFPLVVLIHGGPEAASTLQYDEAWLRQPLAADGYGVFEPNYRGSDNLGNAHEHAIYRDPGEGPRQDVLSGIAALKAAGIVDGSRISIAGHSYGGFMTAWLISHANLWKSAVVSDGLTDWLDLYNLSADGNHAMARESLGGTPADPECAELYHTGSPITYAANIVTPTLILHGTADETVPITESFALYHALADRKVPVVFIAVPGAHHHPSDPVRSERFMALMEDWIRKHDP